MSRGRLERTSEELHHSTPTNEPDTQSINLEVQRPVFLPRAPSQPMHCVVSPGGVTAARLSDPYLASSISSAPSTVTGQVYGFAGGTQVGNLASEETRLADISNSSPDTVRPKVRHVESVLQRSRAAFLSLEEQKRAYANLVSNKSRRRRR